MTDDKEKLIQQLLDSATELREEQFMADETEDISAYKQIYSILKVEPEEGLPFAFKAKLFERIKLEKKLSSDFKLYLISGIFISIGLLTIGFIGYSFADVFKNYLPIIIKSASFGLIIIIAAILSGFYEKKYNTQ